MGDSKSNEDALRAVDWRHRAASTLAQDLPYAGPGTQAHKAGSAVIFSTAVKHHDKAVFLNMPDASAILLGQARREYLNWRSKNPLLAGKNLDDATLTFDCLSHGMAAVLAGYTAVEAFVNDSIPDGATFKRKTRKGKTERLDHAGIIRRCSLNEKMTEVLPSLRRPDASQAAEWSDFGSLQRLRHRIIHTKKEDVTHYDGQGDPPDTVWSAILASDLPSPANTAWGLMKYISAPDPPHWLKFFDPTSD